MIHLDAKYVVRGETIADLPANVYADIKEKYNNRDYITSHIMMSPKNEITERIKILFFKELQKVCDGSTLRSNTCTAKCGFSRINSGCFISD